MPSQESQGSEPRTKWDETAESELPETIPAASTTGTTTAPLPLSLRSSETQPTEATTPAAAAAEGEPPSLAAAPTATANNTTATSFAEDRERSRPGHPHAGSGPFRVTLRSKRQPKSLFQLVTEKRTKVYLGVFLLSVLAFHLLKRRMRGTPNMGYQSTREVTRDYIGFFVIVFFMARYLSMASIVLLWTTILAFHFLFNIHYYDDQRTGLHGQHLQYFFMVYLVSLGILVAMKNMIKPKRRRDFSRRTLSQ